MAVSDARASLGRYELVRRLTASRMAEVFLARDRGAQLETTVVVKRMLPHLVRDAALVEDFLSEARTAAMLGHSNLVRVDHIARDSAQCFYAMEYVRGLDLRTLTKQLAKQGWTMSLECAITIGIELCAGLAFAHERTGLDGKPLVHRDVAPANVLLSAAGEVKLTDFGRVTDPARRAERTTAGTIRKAIDIFEGTVGYMSPEQCLGEPLDARSDLYSLGAILYELTTGARLHDPRENDFQILERTVRGWVTPPIRHCLDYPEELQGIVMRAIERDPGKRYQTTIDLQRDLEAMLGKLRPTTASTAIAELVSLATPRRTKSPTMQIDDVPTTVTPMRHTEPPVSRWLCAPWRYLALAGAAVIGMGAAVATTYGDPDATPAAVRRTLAAPPAEAAPAPAPPIPTEAPAVERAASMQLAEPAPEVEKPKPRPRRPAVKRKHRR